MKTFRIRFVKGALLGHEFTVGETPVIVGRSRGSDIRVPDQVEFQDVSRSHVMLVNQGDVLLVVNMSSHTTLINGQEMPLNHKAQLMPGMSIAMGSSTEFRVLEPSDEMFEVRPDETQDEAEKEHVPSGKTQATIFGEASAVETNAAITSAPVNGATGELTGPMTEALEVGEGEPNEAPFIPEEEKPESDDSDAPFVSAGDEDGPDPKRPDPTRPPETPICSPEELEKLLQIWRRKKLLKIYKRVGIYAGSFLVIAIAYFCMRPNPETRLTWQRRADGKYDDKQIVFNTVLGDKAVGVLCPQDSRTSIRTSSNGVTVVNTYIGRDRDVPLRLKFSCEKDRANLKKSRDRLFDEKRRQLEEAGGWNFLTTSPVGFLGPNNGIPYREAQYLRSERSSSETLQWFGHLIFAVHGDCALTFTREIPAVEQWRGGNFLARETMLMFGDQIINGHWEGRPDFRNAPEESMLAEVDGLLNRRSPLSWKEVEFLLQSVMIRSGGSGKSFEEAHKRLVQLRAEQRLEYNRLQAEEKKDNLSAKTSKQMSATMAGALRIFSSPDDKRNYLLKKGRWK